MNVLRPSAMHLDARSLGLQAPFRSNLDVEHAEVTVTGTWPDWLRGQVIRTAPAVFQQGTWAAEHWFDGLGMLYAFSFDGSGNATFHQRRLASEFSKTPEKMASFGTSMKRGFFKRLFQPIPPQADNTNVNIVPFGDDLVALTETSTQWVIDPKTLEAKHHLDWHERPPNMLAHPQLDFERRHIVNVSSEFGLDAALSVFEHEVNSRTPKQIARWPLKRLPYVHSFGLTAKHVVLVAHPFDVLSLSMLWSNHGFIEHFAWHPQQSTRLAVIDRATGAIREHQCRALFTFHTVNTFEDGETTVLDLIGYDDANVISQLSAGNLATGYPRLKSRLLRVRMTRGQETASVTALCDANFEFPAIHYRQRSGRPYQTAWGTSLWPDDRAQLTTRVLKIDVDTGTTSHFEDGEYLFGEPLFAARPNAAHEQDGVLLVVGSHRSDDRACLQVLDAASLKPLARAEVCVPLPLGFHGSFLKA